MSRILIIEDDKEILKILSDFLSLDLLLPYKSGDQLLKEIRSCSDLPVIVISARGTTQNKIDLLRLGADDYITKPFDPVIII